jgi:flagellar export protein FliJ
MNTSLPTRPWPLLVEKALRDVDDSRKALHEAQARVTQLQATEQRLFGMLNDYRERHRQQLHQGQLMGDQVNSQRFILQLQQLHLHAQREAKLSEAMCMQKQQTLVRMQTELEKMQKLAEQELCRQKKAASKAEDKRLDEMAVMRFRLYQA